MKVVSLFSGGGGLDLGFQKAGFEVVWANEYDPKIWATYEHNHPDVPLDRRSLVSIKSDEIPDADGIIGGPPCFIAGTKVLTDTGYKNIEQVTLEDRLLTHTGFFQPIVNLQQHQHTGSLFYIKTENQFKPIVCTGEHPFYARRCFSEKPTWVPARDLTLSHYLGIPLTRIGTDYRQIITLFKNIIFDLRTYWKEFGQIFIKYIPRGYGIFDGSNVQRSDVIGLCKLFLEEQISIYSYRLALQIQLHLLPDVVTVIILDDHLGTYQVVRDFGDKKQRFHHLGALPISSDNFCRRISEELLDGGNSDKNMTVHDNMMWFPIDSIQKRMPSCESVTVYNFEVAEDNSYCVQNVIVHNCQAWSASGKNAGFEDTRGSVFLEYLRVIRDKTPKFFLIENVEGLLRKTHRASLDQIVNTLSELGYNLQYKLLNAADYEVPQDRKRVIFIGVRSDLIALRFTYPTSITPMRTLGATIGDLDGKATIGNSAGVSEHDYLPGPWSSQFMSRNRVRTWNEQSFTIPASGRHVPVHPSAPLMVHVGRDQFKFVEGQEDKYRRFTLRECARIQTFPDSYELRVENILDGYKIIGNAVPVNLAYHIALAVARMLREEI